MEREIIREKIKTKCAIERTILQEQVKQLYRENSESNKIEVNINNNPNDNVEDSFDFMSENICSEYDHI